MDTLPPNVGLYLPVLIREQRRNWPDLSMPQALPAQVEQETCPSLKSPRCWNPHTELKTSREYGFGLGQITITSRFNTFKEAQKLPGLQDWQWDDRYNPQYQLRALVLQDHQGYNLIKEAHGDDDRLAFSLAAYNGGLGGVLSDRRVCAATPDCDPGRWFGNVERTSLKARAVASGYGQSFFDINRGYVRNVLKVRPGKYEVFYQPEKEFPCLKISRSCCGMSPISSTPQPESDTPVWCLKPPSR